MPFYLLEIEARCWTTSAEFWRVWKTQEPHRGNSGRYLL